MNKQDLYNMMMVRVDFWNITPGEKAKMEKTKRENETFQIQQKAFATLVCQYYLLFDKVPDGKEMKRLLEKHGLEEAKAILKRAKEHMVNPTYYMW